MNRRSLASGSNDTAAHLPRVEESADHLLDHLLAAQAATRRLQMASAPLLEVCGVQPPEHQDMRPEHSSDVEIDSGDRPRVRSSTSAIVLDSGDRPRAVELPLCQHSQNAVDLQPPPCQFEVNAARAALHAPLGGAGLAKPLVCLMALAKPLGDPMALPTVLCALYDGVSPPPGACCQPYRRDDGAGDEDSPTSREVQQRDAPG